MIKKIPEFEEYGRYIIFIGEDGVTYTNDYRKNPIDYYDDELEKYRVLFRENGEEWYPAVYGEDVFAVAISGKYSYYIKSMEELAERIASGDDIIIVGELNGDQESKAD